ncbi:hypothetical protein C8Q70DRAFT_1086597 [Cubamyces menziesii]|nr:hypothetical protein C8Q70DRAFT_1086597 [Cubamyces menziesii]
MPPFRVPSLQDTFGALFIGMCICILLYGMTLHQTYLYWRFFQRDPRFLKFVVSLIIAKPYNYLVIDYFNPLRLLSDTCSQQIDLSSFYTRRVYMIDPSYRVLVALAIILLVSEFGFMVALTVKAFQGHKLTVSIDSIVSGVLITVLLKSKTGFKRTDSLIQTLMVYTINTGVIAGILTFVFALVMPGNLIYTAVGVVATKLYANSVLAVLNARRSLSERVGLDGSRTNTLQFGGNLQPTTSSAVWGRRNTHPVTVSLPHPANTEEPYSSEQGMESEADVDSAPAAVEDTNKV